MSKKVNKDRLEEMPLDDYEIELQKFLNRGQFVSKVDFPEQKKVIEEAATNHRELQESKSITLRIKKRDLLVLKVKAARNNLPYQTLVGLLIRNYNEGKTKLSL